MSTITQEELQEARNTAYSHAADIVRNMMGPFDKVGQDIVKALHDQMFVDYTKEEIEANPDLISLANEKSIEVRILTSS